MAEFPAYKPIPVDDLIPYARNSRTHSDEQITKLAASIREFGFLNPVITDGKNGLVAGHGRVLAAKKLGLTELPAIEAKHLTEAQKRAYVIADNRMALDAGWDDEMLRVELADLDAVDFDLSLTGFELDEIADMLAEEVIGETDEDAVPEVPDQPVTVEGDVWLLGRHRLMCGDSTSIDAVERLMDGATIDCVVTDPPYNQETEGGFKHDVGAALKKQSNDIGFMCDFDPETWLPVVAASFPKGKMNATIFCNKDLIPEYLSWARGANYSFNILIWKKPNAIPLGGSYMPDVEYCLVFRKSGIFNGAISDVSYSKVLSYGRERGLHPTMKPVDMLKNQIRIVSNAGGVVLDYFGGSGSTLIACEKTARDCRMMELDPKYCDVIIKRWQDFTGEGAIHEESGKTYEEMSNDCADVAAE